MTSRVTFLLALAGVFACSTKYGGLDNKSPFACDSDADCAVHDRKTACVAHQCVLTDGGAPDVMTIGTGGRSATVPDATPVTVPDAAPVTVPDAAPDAPVMPDAGPAVPKPDTSPGDDCRPPTGPGSASKATMDNVNSCVCDGVWGECDVNIDALCVEGLACPLELTTLRRELASLDGRVDGFYSECAGGFTTITFGLSQLVFASDGSLVIAYVTDVCIPPRFRRTACAPQQFIGGTVGLSASDPAYKYSELPSDCTGCGFGTNATCVVDPQGNISLP